MILDRIVDEKKKEVEEYRKCRRSLKEKLARKGLTLLAEIKKASPSKGIIAREFNPEKQLLQYINGGADAISILTDEKFFQGGKDILQRLRSKTELPILRKDFIIYPLQVYESFFLGADIILLIAAILEEKELCRLVDLTHELGMEALVEVHDQEELTKVFKSRAQILGINNRNLKDFTVDLSRTAELIEYLKKQGKYDNYYIIAESGVRNSDDIDYLRETGVHGVLIGEALMSASDPVEKINNLFNRGGVVAD